MKTYKYIYQVQLKGSNHLYMIGGNALIQQDYFYHCGIKVYVKRIR